MICDSKCPYRWQRRCVAAGKDVFDMKRCPSTQTIMKEREEENERKTDKNGAVPR